MTTLFELIAKCDQDNIINILTDKYLDIDIPSHIAVLERLRYMVPHEGSDFEIVLGDCDGHIDVSGYKKGEDMLYAIEFNKWQEWLAMKITDITLAVYNTDEIVAHCLYEMTAVGFDEDEIRKERDLLDDLRADVDNIKYHGE